MRHFRVHVLIYMAATLGCAMSGLFLLGFLFLELYHRAARDTIIGPPGLIVSILFYAFYVFEFIFVGLYGSFLVVFAVHQLLLPLSQDLKDPFREKFLFVF